MSHPPHIPHDSDHQLLYIGGWGVSPTGKLVSVSFRVRVVRAVRAGEAKLRVRVSGDGFCRWGLGRPDLLLLLLLLLRRGFGASTCVEGFMEYVSPGRHVPRVFSARLRREDLCGGF